MVDSIVVTLRKPSRKYPMFHRDHRQEDKRRVMPILEAFAEEFDISYDKITISKSAHAVGYVTESSAKGEGDGFTIMTEWWLISAWFVKYKGRIEYEEIR